MITELLLVDDHHAFQGVLRELLNAETDMRILGEANDGESAIRLAQELQPHVVLMDVVMPGVGGIEATRQIISANAHVKVIAISMHAEAGFVDAMRGAGATGYVLKDRTTTELLEAIRTVVNGVEYFGSGLS